MPNGITAKRRLLALLFMLAILTLWWVAANENSPLRAFFLYHPATANILTMLSLPAVILGIVIGGNAHQPNEFVAFSAAAAQWYLVGYLLASVVIDALTTPQASHDIESSE